MTASARLAVLLGHSHTGALVQAITARKFADHADPVPLHVAMFRMYEYDGKPPYLVTDSAGTERFNPLIFEGIARYVAEIGPPVFVTSFGGNDWAVLAMMKHHRPFDFILPGFEHLPLDESAELLPFQFVKALLATLTDRYLYQLYHLRKASEAPIYLFLPPPPIGDDGFITTRMDDFFRKHADFSGVVGSRSLRMKMWLLQKQLYEKVCRETDVTVIGVPDGALDPDGYLAEACRGQDATHANPAYGALMLHQAEALLGATLRHWYWFPD